MTAWVRRRPRRRIRPLAERFWAQVDKTPGFGPWGNCWRWTGSVGKNGYGSRINLGHREDGFDRPHRIAFFLAHGHFPHPEGAHTCDVRCCVNDAHIFEATQAQNLADMTTKGRRKNCQVRGEAHHNAKLTEAQAREIRCSREPYAAEAQRFNVSESLVKQIRRGVAWRHLGATT